MMYSIDIPACHMVLIQGDPYLSGWPFHVKCNGAGSGNGIAFNVKATPTNKARIAGICVHRG